MVWKKVCEAVEKAVMDDLLQRIGSADALEGVALEGIADGEGHAVGGLVVVLGERLLGGCKVDGWPLVAW